MHRIRTLSALLTVSVLIVGTTSCTRSKKGAPGSERAVVSQASQAMESQRQKQDAVFNTEEYGRITENEFLEAVNNPLSTFSIDVDTASYSNVRRFINQGQLPPADAVRIEELINYFKYKYPEPEGDEPFSISAELAACPWEPAHKLIHIGLQGKRIPLANAPANNLVFLMDTSGSMNSPDKLPLLKSAFKLLTDQLREQDRVAIVAYAGSAGLVLPSTSGSDKKAILSAIDTLEAGGSTAGGVGINLAYEVARKSFMPSANNRVILATDGDFNVGVSSDGELLRLIERERESGVFLTVLGFGTGNIKDSKMELLADKGNGNYAYVDTIHEARKVLVSGLGGTLNTIAKDVKVQVEFNPAKVQAYRLIGYENRLMRAEEFNDDRKDAGELGAGHSVTALYEIIPVGVRAKLTRVDQLKYQSREAKPEAFAGNELMTVKLRYKAPKEAESAMIARSVMDEDTGAASASENTRFAAAVAEFGMLLRDSKLKGRSSFENCLALARESRGDDPEGYRAEFISLVEKSAELKRNQ
ncbi:MAG TPA: VWA domain-containing protein [Blastocatellia bacterium]|nr:VWA domain-containing protein [Blastocatellia bacterium]